MKTKFALWLIYFLVKEKRATRERIEEAWSDYINEPVRFHRNTFANYRREAEELFGVLVDFDNRTKEYFIRDAEDLLHNAMQKWLLQSVSASEVLSRKRKLRKRISLETTSGGEEFLECITRAMEENRCVNIMYQPFWNEPKPRCVAPYFIKLFKHRWYLIGMNMDKQEMRIYGFDRIKSVEISDRKFIMPEDADAETCFMDYYGIMLQPKKTEIIRLRLTAEQGMYLRTNPLHHTQNIVHEDADYMEFELYLKPCYDFVQELLSYGSELEVLAPESLRCEIKKYVEEMNELYTPKSNG